MALADFQALPELAGNALVPRVLALADRDRDGYLRLQDFTDAVGELGRLHTDSARAACARPVLVIEDGSEATCPATRLRAACTRPHASVPCLWKTGALHSCLAKHEHMPEVLDAVSALECPCDDDRAACVYQMPVLL